MKGCDWAREGGRMKGGEPAEVGDKKPEEVLEGLVGFDGARIRLGGRPNAVGLDEKDD